MGRIIQEKQNDTGQNGYIQEKVAGPHFVGRVGSIPIIKDSVLAITNKTSIGRFAVSKANSTLQYAIEHRPTYLASYYTHYIQPQVEKADAFGCRSLDIIQKRYPVVNQSTSEIIYSVTQPSYQMINGVKVRLDSTLQAVTHPAHVAVREANKQFTAVVDNLENIVDKYLPADSDTKKIQEEDQVKRAYGVFSEASQRISQKLPKSHDELNQLVAQNALLVDIQSKLNFVQEALVQSISVYGAVAKEKLPPSVITRVNQAIALFSQVSETTHQQLGHIADTDWLKQSLQAVQQQTVNFTHEFKNIIKTQ